MPLLFQINRLLALPLLGLVWVYQRTLSPDHGWCRAAHPYGFCRFAPSCSQFALEGLRQHGLIALPRIAVRVLRCQPWAAGGFDPYKTVTH